MDKTMEFFGGMILACLAAAGLCALLLVGFVAYMHIHDCPADYDRCGIFPIKLGAAGNGEESR